MDESGEKVVRSTGYMDAGASAEMILDDMSWVVSI
jgi:hypothetical protein